MYQNGSFLVGARLYFMHYPLWFHTPYASQVLRYTSENVFVPLTVGGGIRDFTDSTGRYYC